jgi:hypothetical protein
MSDTPRNPNKPAPPKRLAQIITLSTVAIALVHIFWPNLAIDAITLALIAIAIVPWLAPIFKSLEFPGGWKVEFKEQLQKAANRAEEAGILAPLPINFTHVFSPPQIPYSDPNLALAALRIEIEKRLRTLAQKHDLPVTNLSKMLQDLTSHNVLDEKAQSALGGLIDLLNHAVHGGMVDPESAEFITTNMSPSLLKYLDDLAR